MPPIIVANPRMAMVFDENQPKYKICCGCMNVRTGAAIIATLKVIGVLMAVLELFSGPHFITDFPQNNILQTTSSFLNKPSTTIKPFFSDNSDENNDFLMESTPAPLIGAGDGTGIGAGAGSNGFGAIRFASTAVYLLVEAVAVSCLIYALRRERPKFVIPEMALILVCMSLELVMAILVIIAASFGSESLVQMVVNRIREQGTEMTSGDVDQIRRLIPFVLVAFAFCLFVGAAIEYWFFRTLKMFYGYLRDKMMFGAMCGDTVEVQHHCYANGYHPMVEESGANETDPSLAKDMPPAYQDVVKPEEQAQATATDPVLPPSYTEFVDNTSPARDNQNK